MKFIHKNDVLMTSIDDKGNFVDVNYTTKQRLQNNFNLIKCYIKKPIIWILSIFFGTIFSLIFEILLRF